MKQKFVRSYDKIWSIIQKYINYWHIWSSLSEIYHTAISMIPYFLFSISLSCRGIPLYSSMTQRKTALPMGWPNRIVGHFSWMVGRNEWERRVSSVSLSLWRLKCQCFQSFAVVGRCFETSRTAIPFRVSRASSFFLMTTERSEKCSLLRQKVCQVEILECASTARTIYQKHQRREITFVPLIFTFYIKREGGGI